jgi:hypothetical protein
MSTPAQVSEYRDEIIWCQAAAGCFNEAFLFVEGPKIENRAPKRVVRNPSLETEQNIQLCEPGNWESEPRAAAIGRARFSLSIATEWFVLDLNLWLDR